MGVREDLIAVRALIDTPEKCACGGKRSGWSLHQAIDNTCDDDDRYRAAMWALEAARPDIPATKKGLVAWSHEDATHPVLMQTFARAIAKAGASHV